MWRKKRVIFSNSEFLDIGTYEDDNFYNIKTESKGKQQLKNKRERGKMPCEICGKVMLIKFSYIIAMSLLIWNLMFVKNVLPRL